MSDLDPDLVEPPYAMQAHMGFRMTGWAEGWSRFEMPLAPTLMNRFGIPHGGVYATLLDTVMGHAGSYTGKAAERRLVMTLTLTVSFVAQPRSETLIGEGHVVGGGRRTFFAEGRVLDETGALIATGSGSFRVRGEP